MSDYQSVCPKTESELLSLLTEIKESATGYEEAAQAMTDAAHVAFNYIASTCGCTGFQASFAQLRFVAQQRGAEHPLMLVDSGKQLYPQYDVAAEVSEFLNESLPQVAKTAKDKLESVPSANPRVRAHWQKLVDDHYEGE